MIPVHLFGNPAPIGELREAIGDRPIRILEDAAQAVGASLGESAVGSLGDAAAFSFHPAKNLPAFGDGGALVTDDDDVAALARRLRAHGSDDKVIFTEVGYNSRLDALQAAGLRVLLPHLDEWTDARRRAAAAYADSGMGRLVELPAETEGGRHCYQLFVVRSPARDRLVAELAKGSVEARAYYTVPLHRQPALAPYDPPASLPEAESASAETVALPMGPSLEPAQIDQVHAAVAGALAGETAPPAP